MLKFLLLITLTTKVNLAPILSESDGQPRESTKAILNLEQQLKESAGEDKKYFSNDPPPEAPPAPPVVDGLEQDEEVLQALASDPDSQIQQTLDANIAEIPSENEVPSAVEQSAPVEDDVPIEQNPPVDPSFYDYLMTVLEEHPEFKQILQPPENDIREVVRSNNAYPDYETSFRNTNMEQPQPDVGDTAAYVVSKKGSYETPPEYLQWLAHAQSII